MSEKNDLTDANAVAKIRELVESANTCMFGTDLGNVPGQFVPMAAIQVEDDGSVWFFSGADSSHNENLERDPRAQLIFAKPDSVEFLNLFGEVQILRDSNRVEELWKPMHKAWFPDGKSDPNLTLLRFTPQEGHYWDTKDGKLVTMAKIAFSALSESYQDGGVEGELRV